MTAPLALPPAPAPARPRVLFTATALGVAAAAMLMAGLIGIYLEQRAAAGGTTADWLPEGASLPLLPANMALITMLMSSITVQWAVYAMGRNDRRHVYLALGLTTLFGVSFINSMGFLFSQLGTGIGDSVFGTMAYAVLGTMTAYVIAAIVFVVLMGFRALGGQFSPRDREGLASAALAWHFVVLCWFVVNATVVWMK
jgi:heme/copper-type cytochrome/quinol oxidase subunit 3